MLLPGGIFGVWLNRIRLLSGLVLGQTSYNLDLLRFDMSVTFHLEIGVLDDESPNFVAEAVGIEVTLPFQQR